MCKLPEVKLNDNQIIWKNQTLESLRRHKQGALHIATGGGKSYIAKSIINDILEDDETAEVLWISRSSDSNNIEKNFFNSENYETRLYKNIKFLGFETLRVSEDFAKNLEFSNLKLIVIDEAQGALAEKTYKSVKYLIDSLVDSKIKREKPYLLVMTASGTRSCDNKKVFDTLVPKLVAGVDYDAVPLDEALDRGILGKVNFITSNIYKYELMANLIMRQVKLNMDNNIFKSKKTELDEMLKYIRQYNSNMATYLGNDINVKIKDTYNAEDGDQWVVFYSTTEKALESTKFLNELFSKIYEHNKNVKINIYQYHNKMTNEENEEVNRKMYTKPDKNTVNVYVTVLKGIQSIHPENVVGEIQFRNTSSLNLYEQAIGRVTKAKEYADKPVFVIDVVGNQENVRNGQSIYYGTNDIVDRIGQSIKDDLAIENILKNRYLDNISIDIINSKFERIVSDYNNLKEYSFIKENAMKIANTIKSVIGEEFKYKIDYNPYIILHDILGQEQGKEMCEFLKRIQNRFISGEFGKTTIDKLDEATEIYKMLYNTLGNIMFVSLTAIRIKSDYTELYEMANSIKSINYDYSNLCKVRGLKTRIDKYKEQFLKCTLPIAVIEFCDFYKINIRGKEDDIVYLAIDKSKFNDNIKKELHILRKKLNRAELDYKSNRESLVIAYAYYTYIQLMYRNSNIIPILNAINTTYKCLTEVSSIPGCKKGKNIAISLINIIKRDKILDEVNTGLRNRHLDYTEYDQYIVRTARELSVRYKFTLYESEILNIFGINTRSARFNTEASKLMNYTNIGNIIYKLENCNLNTNEKLKLVEKLQDVVTCMLPIEWGRKVESIRKEYISNDDDKVDKQELMMSCRYKINTLDEIDDKGINSVKNQFKRAFKTLNIGELLSSCFNQSYEEYVVDAINNIAKGDISDDDSIILKSAFDISKGYEGKLMFIKMYVLKDTEFESIADNLIKRQVNI